MGTKENFSQAMSEVFPFYKNREFGPGAKLNPSNLAKQEDGDAALPKGKEPLNFQSIYDTNKQQHLETAHITKDTRITGNIITKSNIDINGSVFGDVESQNCVKVSGRIEGNITGKSVEINNAIIKGNIHATERLSVTNQSEILGNLSASELDLNGRITGNIHAKKSVTIQKDSCVIGEIEALSIGIEKGAIVKGTMNVTGEKAVSEEEKPV
jgi:cytoskeletal protein CcmA (bactofilin family)